MDSPSKIARQSAAVTRVTRGLTVGFGVLRRHLWIWPLLAAAMLAVAGLGIRRSVESAAQMEMREGLEAILKSNVEALRIWFENEEAQAVAFASESGVCRLAGKLRDLGATDTAALVQSPYQEDFQIALGPALAGKRFAGYVLLVKDHLVLASNRPELIGQVQTTRYDMVGRTLERGRLVTPPFPSVLLTKDAGGQLRAGQPTMFATAVQRDSTGEIVGVLGLRIKPDEDFARILQIARPG